MEAYERRVMIAEPEASLMVMLTVLVEQVGHEVVATDSDLSQIAHLASRDCPDVVILHWNGQEEKRIAQAITHLRTSAPQLCVVAVIDASTDGARAAALAAGATTCIANPPTTVEMLLAIEAGGANGPASAPKAASGSSRQKPRRTAAG